MTTIDPRLVAIDPAGCGCTECLIGEYRPADQASDDEIGGLFLGLLRDNTSEPWHITQDDLLGGFHVSGPCRPVHVASIAVPIPVEHYRLEANQDVIADLAAGASHID